MDESFLKTTFLLFIHLLLLLLILRAFHNMHSDSIYLPGPLYLPSVLPTSYGKQNCIWKKNQKLKQTKQK